jgi:predicted AlkP superfamily pyrophosphatase or phosphodiesterase
MKRTVLYFFAFFYQSVTFAQVDEAPKLVVGIVVDQMCYEYLYRYYDKFSDNGFRKLMEKGTNCRNTHYNYVPTFTGPGHASIYTGTTPNNHGIVANEWFDRKSNALINCVDDADVSPVGTTSSDGLCSPKNLKTNTVSDQLKLTYSASKVISMSIKDRGAILPGGHLSDGSFWYDYETGKFITSSFFMSSLPSWVNEFNDTKFVENYIQKDWETLYPISSYTESGPDDSPYENKIGNKAAPTFPYDLKELSASINPNSLFTITPFSNTVLTDFAIKAISSEGLGQDDITDMLCVSYSTPDIAGHSFGPYSVEIEDMYLRLDLEIARFIKELEKQVGKKNFVLFLTADHAVVPVPQYLIDNNLPGGYFFMDTVISELRKETSSMFGFDPIITEENLSIYLDKEKIEAANQDVNEIAHFIKKELEKYEEIKAIYTAEELKNGSDDEWRDMIFLGYHPKGSGDVMFILEPGYLPKSTDSESARRGTSHGSAFNYDTHVPLIWYGSGIEKQEIHRRIEITDIGATLINLMNLQRNGAMTGNPILELFDTKH